MTKWWCPACKRWIARDARIRGLRGKKSVMSYCERTKRDVRMRRAT